jgi:hypothetical protein
LLLLRKSGLLFARFLRLGLPYQSNFKHKHIVTSTRNTYHKQQQARMAEQGRFLLGSRRAAGCTLAPGCARRWRYRTRRLRRTAAEQAAQCF